MKNQVIIKYCNYRGEIDERLVTIYEWFFGVSEFHKEEQWLFRAWCHKRKQERIFALSGVLSTRSPCPICLDQSNYICEHCENINKESITVGSIIRGKRSGELHIVEEGLFCNVKTFCFTRNGQQIFLINGLWNDNFDVVIKKQH